MKPEWSRPERLDTIGDPSRTVDITATEPERAALARRFGLIAVDRLEARIAIKREGSGVLATGRVSGAVVQACSITGDPLPVTIDEPLALRFIEPSLTDEEVELSADALDTIEIEGSSIDLGEAAAETMALTLDPFPRGPGGAKALAAAGVIAEDEIVPFSPFAGLKARMERDGQ